MFAVVLTDLRQPRPIILSVGIGNLLSSNESIEATSGPAFARELFQGLFQKR